MPGPVGGAPTYRSAPVPVDTQQRRVSTSEDKAPKMPKGKTPLGKFTPKLQDPKVRERQNFRTQMNVVLSPFLDSSSSKGVVDTLFSKRSEGHGVRSKLSFLKANTKSFLSRMFMSKSERLAQQAKAAHQAMKLLSDVKQQDSREDLGLKDVKSTKSTAEALARMINPDQVTSQVEHEKAMFDKMNKDYRVDPDGAAGYINEIRDLFQASMQVDRAEFMEYARVELETSGREDDELIDPQLKGVTVLLNHSSGEYGARFRVFLATEYATENRDFMLAVGTLSKQGTISDQQMQRLYDRYIKLGADQEVNLSGPIRQVVIKAMSKTPPDYDAARAALPDVVIEVNQVLNDSYHRFVAGGLTEPKKPSPSDYKEGTESPLYHKKMKIYNDYQQHMVLKGLQQGMMLDHDDFVMSDFEVLATKL